MDKSTLTSEIQWKHQFFYRKTSRKSVFSSAKGRFGRKIQVLTPKTRFSLGKVYYSGNLSFSREKLLENPRFFSGEKAVLSEKYKF